MTVIGSLTRRPRLARRRAFIESYAFPAALRQKLGDELGDEARVLPALEALRAWYLTCLYADGELLGMPSRAVDVAWHEMILMTREYHSFCERAFGRYLHHSPEAVTSEPMEGMLAHTLAVLDQHSTDQEAVPRLFAVDTELGLKDGYAWTPDDVERLRRVRPDYRTAGAYGWAAAGCGGGHGGGCSGGGCSGGGGGCGGSG
jgi:hypothetical protein